MQYLGRRLVKSEDLNPSQCLFGGTLLRWLDEEAYIFAACQLKKKHIVTKLMSEINFLSPSYSGDVIEFGMKVTALGRSSITFSAKLRKKDSHEEVLNVETIVMVCVDDAGQPLAHSMTMASLENT